MLRKPTAGEVDEYVREQSLLGFSYPSVGGTRDGIQTAVPEGFKVLRRRVLLGQGEVVYQAACELVRQWRMFPVRWTEIQPLGAALDPGTTVAMLARCFGKWWLNSCRIVYTIDETSSHRRFGFAYGTLPGHVESGEERFQVEWDASDQVWFEISSFSRPRHWLVRLAAPLARRQQLRFLRESMIQMQRLVTEAVAVSSV